MKKINKTAELFRHNEEISELYKDYPLLTLIIDHRNNAVFWAGRLVLDLGTESPTDPLGQRKKDCLRELEHNKERLKSYLEDYKTLLEDASGQSKGFRHMESMWEGKKYKEEKGKND